MTVAFTQRGDPEPFHGNSACASRRLLLLSHHFPPDNSVGSLRWRKFAKFAVERDWGLDVVTVAPSSLAAPDWDGLSDLPPDVRVFGASGGESNWDRIVKAMLASLRSLSKARALLRPPGRSGESPRQPESLSVGEMHWPPRTPRELIRAHTAWRFFARDARWAVAAGRVGRAVLNGIGTRAVVTSGPPHMIHEIGRNLAAEAGLPFVMDMRDLWSLLPRLPDSHASPLWLTLARRYERRAVEAATLVVVNTEAAQRAMQSVYPAASERIIAVLNGYDEEEIPCVERGTTFVVAYAGSIYLDRDPHLLFRAVARVVRELSLTPEQLRVEFMGEVASYGGAALEAIAKEEGIGTFVRLYPPQSRRRAREFLARAAMLVSLPQDMHTAIPSKIFEYAQFEAWLLALAEPHSATALMLRDTGADVVAPNDPDGIADVLRTRYLAHARGARPVPPHLPETLSRRAQAHRFFDQLERRLEPLHLTER